MIIRALIFSVFCLQCILCNAQGYYESSKGANGKFGFINQEGNWSIQPKYDEVTEFSSGFLAFVRLNGKWGLIDTLDQIVHPFTLSKILVDEYIFDADLYVVVMRDNKYGVINQTTGKYLIECIYDKTFSFTDGIIPALGNLSVVYRNGKSGLINEKGEEFVSCIYDNVKNPFEDLYINSYATAQQNNKVGVIDTLGQLVVPCVYDEIKANEEYGTLDVIRNKKHGVFSLVDKKELVPPLYDYTFWFDGDYAIVQLKKKFGAVNRQGRVVVPINFNDEGAVLVELDKLKTKE